MLVIGDKEAEGTEVAVRSRDKGELGTKDITEFANELVEEVKSKKFDL